MKYTYTDKNNKNHTIDLRDDDSITAVQNDYQELVRRYNPDRVSIMRLNPAPGALLHLLVTVHAPSHYLEHPEDTCPKPCSAMSAHVVAYMGYPIQAVDAWYESDAYLASPNVFTSGWACIDKWIPFKSSLVSVCDKLLHDMIHDPTVTSYTSRANLSDAITAWHKKGAAGRVFPTIDPRLLYADAAAPRPQKNAPPPLPMRR